MDLSKTGCQRPQNGHTYTERISDALQAPLQQAKQKWSQAQEYTRSLLNRKALTMTVLSTLFLSYIIYTLTEIYSKTNSDEEVDTNELLNECTQTLGSAYNNIVYKYACYGYENLSEFISFFNRELIEPACKHIVSHEGPLSKDQVVDYIQTLLESPTLTASIQEKCITNPVCGSSYTCQKFLDIIRIRLGMKNLFI